MTSALPPTLFSHLRTLFGVGTLSGLGEGELLERFLTHRDETAFEEIVARHGPMVLGICRRWLSDPQDAEDAFQAVFLILVRKASSLRDRNSLSSWLYGVTMHVAGRARANTSRGAAASIPNRRGDCHGGSHTRSSARPRDAMDPRRGDRPPARKTTSRSCPLPCPGQDPRIRRGRARLSPGNGENPNCGREGHSGPQARARVGWRRRSRWARLRSLKTSWHMLSPRSSFAKRLKQGRDWPSVALSAVPRSLPRYKSSCAES